MKENVFDGDSDDGYEWSTLDCTVETATDLNDHIGDKKKWRILVQENQRKGLSQMNSVERESTVHIGMSYCLFALLCQVTNTKLVG